MDKEKTATALVHELRATVEQMRVDLAAASDREAHSESLQKTAKFWREQEKADHEAELGRVEAEMKEAARRQKEAEVEAKMLRIEKADRDAIDAAIRAAKALEREQQARASAPIYPYIYRGVVSGE